MTAKAETGCRKIIIILFVTYNWK